MPSRLVGRIWLNSKFSRHHLATSPTHLFDDVVLEWSLTTVFCVFKMVVAILFLCGNAVKAIQIYFISMILNLNGFYSIFTKKCNSHGHLKCIKKHKIKPRCYVLLFFALSILSYFTLNSTNSFHCARAVIIYKVQNW